ncbi:UDP-N-acetylmuramyl pentapeptide phosphotransferase/UDP-N-acetylglucosamine-1-phosphate transferase [Microvirga flocculans]|uniref:UDP-N-acetylmuramyl pentapeptide phosphotransferase/UDP-N-acetylglucosamine-1-phosphate transferase n=1 Tax=Microvirga flocculans TaxID=217168 RepID=A0A7W6ICS7_9HYPH|nr:glycosyl transferase [Microvirga flocculans]MBB4038786.1 UDP-N-acetylmuramyl pentapeptide phosphotransferase/UDP-N-acetylglucosamine-1-phosphate transferase [Microvirga flocculans]
MIASSFLTLACLTAALAGGAVLSVLLIVVLKPLLVRYALARPNARSSHKVPTPQGGGIAVLAACLAAAGAVLLLFTETYPFAVVAAAAAGLAIIGAVDDIRPLPAVPRLVLQTVAVAIVVLASHGRVLPDAIPLAVEQAILVFGGVWFVNLVNFMDGLDWITVAEMVPVTAFIAALWFIHPETTPVGIVAAALCGALLGFAPFNKPVARLFLGDVGSLPIGLLVGWMLLELAGTGALAAALLLPLYYLMDATITLLRRLARREKVWEAHRSHFYQKATDNGFSALQVSAHVFGLNLALAGLAAMTLVWSSGAVQAAALALGAGLVGLLLKRFSQSRPEVAR